MSNKLRSFLIVVISIAVVMAALPMNALRVNADSFTLYYDGNGGVRPITNPDDDATKWSQGSDDNGDATVVDNSSIGFFKEGYAVVGWTDDSNGGGTTYTKGDIIPLTENKTIYAQWAEAYSITFVPDYPDGATGTSGTMGTQNVAIGYTNPLNANQYKCKGYRFAGWEDDEGHPYADKGSFTADSGNVTLHAQWQAVYTITYDANNNTGKVYEATIDVDPTVTSYQVLSNTSCGITSSGYVFTGWNTAKDGTGTPHNAADTITLTSDLTLYAQWARTITFHNNLASDLTDTQDITVGSPTNLNPNTFNNTDTSVSFVGWTTVANPTDKTIEYTDGSSVTLTGDDATDITDLYAQWGKTCKITFDSNYPDGVTGTGTMNPLNAGKGFTTNLNSVYSVTGYTLKGWTTEQTASDVTYNATSISLDENLAENEITLYAQWEINKYTITFMSDGTEISADTYNHGQTPVAPSPEPTKAPTNTEVYSFVGWADSTGTLLDSLPAATGNATYYARFTSSTRHYSVSATANPSAGGTVSGSGSSYEWNSTATVTASANNGYHFVKWTDNGADAGTATTYSFPIDGNHTVVAEFEKNSYTVTLEASAGGLATIDKNTYLYEEVATVVATADTGYTFVNWVQDGQVVSSDPTYTFTVTADSTVKPVFSINSYTISLSSDGNGSVEGAGDYFYSSTATVTATPNTGYHFVNWTDESGTEVNTSSSFSFEVDGARNLTANFAINSYSVNATAGEHGSVSGSGIYNHFETRDLVATPDTGYHFVSWTDENETVVSTNASYSFEVDGARNLTANFAINSYTVDATAGENGSVSGSGTYDYSETCTLVAIPEKGYHFVGWEENGKTVSENANFRFSVTGNRKIKAVFEINMYTVTYKNDDGTILQEGEFPWGSTASYQHMANPTKKPTAQFTYTFAGWDNKETLVTKDITYTATYTYTVNKYKITFANEDGTVLQTSEVEYGKFPVYDKSAPTKSATVEETFTFAGWDKEIATVTGDTVYTATYTSKPITKDSINYKYFTVAFVSNGGSEVVSQLVAEGGVAFKPEEPLRERYSFGGWYIDEALTKPFSFATAITSDITLYAKWVKGAPEVEATYAVIGMGSTTVDISSGEDITIAVERSKDNDSIAKHFVGVQIDGVDVDYYNYELSDDNSSVIISADALNGLDEGTHTITIVYDDGTAEVELIVADSNEPVKTTEEIIEPEPVTGNEEPVNVTAETNNAGLWIALAIVAGVVVAAIPIFIVKIRSLK